jgi:hydrogenase maturation protease
VIGVGSPHGDEAVGLHVAAQLARQELPQDVLVVARDRPGLRLLDDLERARAAVLVHGLRSGDTPGVVRRVSHQTLAHRRAPHVPALHLVETLSQATVLGRRLPPLRIVAIEMDVTSGFDLSPAVEAAVATACAAARAALAELLYDV